MRVADLPDLALSDLDDKALLALSRHWGKVGQVAMRRFLATLPEIGRRGIYRRARCHSIGEYARKYAGASEEVVDTVLRVYRRIGAFECLWSLFSQGRTGLHVFRRISRHVTAENAAWWAEIVRSCTIKEIERILEEYDDASSRRETGQMVLSGSAAPDRTAGREMTSAATGADQAAATQSLAGGMESDPAMGSAPVAANPAAPAGSNPAANRAASEGVRQAASFDDVGGLNHRPNGSEASVEGAVTALRLSAPSGAMVLTPLAASIAENLVAAYLRRGLTVSIAEVVEAALKHVAIGGILPLAVDECDDIRQDSDEPASERPACGEGSCASPRAPSAGARRLRLPRVLVTLSDVGMSFIRTIGGMIPLLPAEAAALDSPRPPLPYSDLLAAAEAAGTQAAGRPIPAVVKLAIAIRSGGRCEARGCSRPLDEFDHLDPYSRTRMHPPRRMAGLCGICHRARHDGLIANPGDPPDQWRTIAIGKPRRSGEVDRQVAACRQRAQTEALEPPERSSASGSRG